MRSLRALAVGLFVLLAVGKGGFAQPPRPPEQPATKPLPPFTLPDLEGRKVSLSMFEGRTPVVIAFIKGTWCPHCVDLLIQLENLKATDLAGVPVLVISPEQAPQVIQFLVRLEADRKIRLTHRFLVDSALQFGPRYGLAREVSSTQGRPPSVLYLDRRGRVLWAWSAGHERILPIGPSLHQRLEEMRPKKP
ncbi:MAG: peroxiredoxin family protein [Acidithiobacillales bacterium]